MKMEQKAIYYKNYVTVDSDLPTLYFYDSEIGKCDDMTKDNKQWINNGNCIQDTKFEMCKELVKLVSEYVEKIW